MGKVHRLGQIKTADTFLLNRFIFCKEEVVVTHFQCGMLQTS